MRSRTVEKSSIFFFSVGDAATMLAAGEEEGAAGVEGAAGGALLSPMDCKAYTRGELGAILLPQKRRRCC